MTKKVDYYIAVRYVDRNDPPEGSDKPKRLEFTPGDKIPARLFLKGEAEAFIKGGWIRKAGQKAILFTMPKVKASTGKDHDIMIVDFKDVPDPAR